MDPITIVAIVSVVLIFRFITTRSSLKKDDAKKIIADGGKVVDVRSQAEFKSGHFKGAINIQHDKIINGIKKAKIKIESPVILYCASGSRSSAALSALKAEGYTNIHNAGTQHKLEKLLS